MLERARESTTLLKVHSPETKEIQVLNNGVETFNIEETQDVTGLTQEIFGSPVSPSSSITRDSLFDSRRYPTNSPSPITSPVIIALSSQKSNGDKDIFKQIIVAKETLIQGLFNVYCHLRCLK